MPLPLRKPVHHAVATVTLAACAPLPGTAAEAGTSALELDPLTVTGTPVPGAVSEQAASLDIVTSDSIVADGDANLGEALADLPGVENIATGNSAGKPVIRGLSGERIRMLSNGVGLDHQQYGVRHMPSYDPFLLERVEVVRGASSVLYGSSALGGAVNLIPREIDYDTDFHGEAMTRYYSNNGQWDTGLRAGAGNGRFGISVGVIRRDAGNIETPDETTYFPPPPNPEHQDAAAYTGDLDYTDFEQAAGDIAVGVRDDRGGEWRLRYTRWNDEHNFLLPPPAGIKPPSAGAEGIGQYIDDEQLSLSGRTRIGNITWKPRLLWQNNERRSNAAGYRVPPDSITPSISSSTSTRPAWRANTAPLPDWTGARWAWNTATRPRSHAGARSSRRAATCTTRRYSPSRRNALARCCCRAGCAMTTTPRRPAPPGHARRRQASAMPKKTATASPPVRSAGSSA